MNRLRLGMLSLAGLVWLGCSSATTTPGGTGGAGNTGGAVGNTGGVVGNTGGVATGSGGVATGSGGVATGSGGVATGSGGVATGSGGVATGTGGGSTTVECTGAATMDGYLDNGQMCGYAWTATNDQGETITPPCGDDTCFMGATVCATANLPANVPADEVYTGVMIGWNVAQASGSSTNSTWTSSGTGLTPTFTITGATGVVRLLVKSGGTDYCSEATSGVAIPWGSFKTECWGTTGTALAVGAPVTAVMLQVNGDDAAAQPAVEMCLTSVTVN